MNVFFCRSCGGRLHFENTRCLACGSAVGYLPELGRLAALAPVGDGTWRAVGADGDGGSWRMCRNYEVEQVCNWMVATDSGGSYCVACALNRTIPDLNVGNHRSLWSRLETAKRRLVYTLLRLGLPVLPKTRDAARGLAFDFLADPDPEFAEGRRVLTGHAQGVVTINVAEADDTVRERMRLDLREVYRTLLGHFRHESGHYYWDLLVRDQLHIDRVRAVFGDERQDYGAALERHYAGGAPECWPDSFVTPYAAIHPWEDWAETWAHYLLIMDTLETAAAQGIEMRESGGRRCLVDPFARPFPASLEDWHALRLLLNSLNRSMGLPDAYPFVITTAVANKLTFLSQTIATRLDERESGR